MACGHKLNLTFSLSYSANDQIAMPVEAAGPPYSGPVPYPSIDLIEVRLGVDSEFLYMRVEIAGPIPSQQVRFTQKGEMEDQIVMNQGMNIALNTDGNR